MVYNPLIERIEENMIKASNKYNLVCDYEAN